MCFVGLFKIRSHFGENFIVGDSYIDGETKIFTYIIPDIRGTCQTVRKTVSDTTIIQITFINTDLLDFYCQRTQEIDEFFTALRVESMIRRNNSKRRTLAQCTGYRFSGLYMIDFFCGNRFGKNNAMPCFTVPSDDGRNCPDIGGIWILFEKFQCTPTQISRIHINMKNNTFHSGASFVSYYKINQQEGQVTQKNLCLFLRCDTISDEGEIPKPI